MKVISTVPMQPRQKGAALVIALIMLLVMTVLGITAMQVTRMEERMAGNSRDVNLAFQAAEAGLRDAELRVETNSPVFCSSAPCVGRPWYKDILPTNLRDQALVWWTANGTEYGVAGTPEITEVVRDPIIVTEEVAFIRHSLTRGDEEAKPGRRFYKATANSAGASTTATVVLESTYAKLELE
jgi:type IV pilus assembly protein PilX